MDPITIAVGAFTALKSGINAGKELHSMGQDLAKLWHAIDDVDAEHANAKKRAFRTVEEEAMETFLAKQKAKDLEDQLRQIIILTRGVGAWAELVKMRADIRVKRQQERAKKNKRKRRTDRNDFDNRTGDCWCDCSFLRLGILSSTSKIQETVKSS